MESSHLPNYAKFIEVWRQKEYALQTKKLTNLLLANASHEGVYKSHLQVPMLTIIAVRTPLNHIIKSVASDPLNHIVLMYN